MRLDYTTLMPEATQAMRGLQEVVDSSGLEHELAGAGQGPGLAAQLLRLLPGHAHQGTRLRSARNLSALTFSQPGERQQMYESRERAALAWCESLTLLSDTGAPDPVYEEVSAQFSPRDLVALSTAIVAINGWNRFAVGLRTPVGSYKSRRNPPAK